MESTPHSKLCSDFSPSSSCGGGSSVGSGGSGYIEHTVSKFDTLAGVAIKYGVDVADIKRMNGLTADSQMFARKSLKIPLPGRHPPSPILSNGNNTQGRTSSEMTPPNRRYSDLFNSIKSLRLSSSSQQNISPSINTLRGYYGLTPNGQNGVAESFETTRVPNPPFGLHRKSKSLANGFLEMCDMDNVSVANEKGAGSDKSIEKLVRQRKSEVDLKMHTPEMLLKQDSSSSSSILSAAAEKGLALRPKAANRTTTKAEAGSPNIVPLGSRDSSIAEAFSGVRKSSSAPSFQHPETNNNTNSVSSTSIWSTSMLSLTADLQALSTAAITRPFFDGLPKPTSGRKNKMALD